MHAHIFSVISSSPEATADILGSERQFDVLEGKWSGGNDGWSNLKDFSSCRAQSPYIQLSLKQLEG